jgi:phosphohistidine swiveling domain-containing protein
LASGRDLVESGRLAAPDDLFFLHFAELRALAGDGAGDWQALVRRRREAYAREQQRHQVPRLLLSDGRAFYAGIESSQSSADQSPGQVLAGSPVSPGTVEGLVRVILDPQATKLAPGEILVCPGTDPAWTPLFLVAAGLVTEVGGLMTHGSVVAREYGIPAVVGVSHATTRLQTGQRVRLDGSTGEIVLLSSERSEPENQ